MEVRIAENAEISQLKKLWREVFDSDGGYTELFFKYRYPTCKCIGLFDGKNLLSAQYLMPCKLKINSESFDIRYVFAVATFPNLQGRGYNTFLLKQTEKYARQLNIDGMALMPANEGLFKYYQKVGYETAFYVDKQEYKITEKSNIRLSKCSLKDEVQIREDYFKKCDGFLSWDSEALEYCERDNGFSNGEVLQFSEICKGYAVCNFSEDSVYVRELICSPQFKREIVNALGNYFKRQKVIVTSETDNKEIPYGMLLSCSESLKAASYGKNLHMSLPMD